MTSRVPRVDDLLADAALQRACEALGPRIVKQTIHAVQAAAWRGEVDAAHLVEAVQNALPAAACGLEPVINATGVVLHTNLGRAPLSPSALDAAVSAGGYVDLEFDRTSGRRGRRGASVTDALLSAVPGAEDALVVNNGAAALVLAATALAQGREILISRGELVEIGDHFRIADLVASTGARLREVGATNRVGYEDYARAVGPDTAFVLKVHPSNFVITGFTAGVAVRELAALPVPVVADIGSGLLSADPLLPAEPDAVSWLADGACIVTASADKLLGGPQAGIVVGQSDIVHRMRRHPLARAMRIDKLRLAALEATVRGPATPTWQALHAPSDQLRVRTDALADRLRGAGLEVCVVRSNGLVGGGGAPDVTLPGWALEIAGGLAGPLRTGRPAVVARVDHGRCLIDLRAVPDRDDSRLAGAIIAVAVSAATDENVS